MVPDYPALAAFRYSILRFLKSGEEALAEASVEPQQYQCMLAIKARRVEGKDAVIGDLAETLMLTHHSCVGLVNRLELRGLVHRSRDAVDGRRVHVELTPIGEDAVESLAKAHQAQLQHLGPELIASLAKVVDVVQHGEPFGE